MRPLHNFESKDQRLLKDVFTRAYRADPTRTHNDLVQLGLGKLAAELKIDQQMGRLEEIDP